MAVRVDRAVVIEAAINGETRPDKNPHVPRTPEAVARDALACLGAGASIIHAHNEDIRLWGREAADNYLAAWRTVLRERPDALWYPTLTVAPDHASALVHYELLAQEVGLRIGVVDPGSTNIGGPFADGLPVGLKFQYHALLAGWNRRITPNVSTRLQYGFYHYGEPSSGGANDYTAHAVFASLVIRLR